MSDMRLASAAKLVAFTNEAPGLFVSSAKEKLHASELSILPTNTLEHEFNGPESISFFERIKEGLSRLPTGTGAQFLLSRAHVEGNHSLFPPTGLRTRLYLIERHLGLPGQGSVHGLVQDLGLLTRALHKEEFDRLLTRIMGVSNHKGGAQIPDLVWEEGHLRAGTSRVCVASLTDAPQATWPAILQGLFEIDDEFLVSIKFNVPDRKKVRRDFETRRRISHALSIQKSHELSNLDSNSTLGAAEGVLKRINEGKEALTNVSFAVIVAGQSLENVSTRIEAIAGDSGVSSGAGLYVEEIGTLPVLRSHIPGQPSLSVRELPMLTGNLAHLLPLLLDHNREQTGGTLKFVSRANEISHLNLFSPTNLNFNAFVCGASGSGKSFLMNALIASFKTDHPEGAISIFDVGGSYRKLVGELGGTSLDLTPDQARALVVASLRRETFRPSGYCKTLIENLCGAASHITHSHRVAIEDLLQSAEGAPFKIKNLILECSERKEKVYADLAHWLKPFASWDDLKTTEADGLSLDAKVRAFDFKNLESDPLLQRLSILVLTNRVWTELKSRGAPRTLVVFDEVWKFFAQASGFLEEMYRTFRKYGAGIASVTQNLSDYGDAAFARMVVTNSFCRIFLQGAATADTLHTTLDMSESDVQRFLSVASQKNRFSEFLLMTPKFSQILRLYPSEALFRLANTEGLQHQEVTA